MNDRLIDLIRSVDPCPQEPPAPPIDPVLRRLYGEPPGAPTSVAGRRRLRLGAFGLTLSSAAVIALAVLAIVVLGHSHGADSSAASKRPLSGASPNVVLTGACRSLVRVGVLPVWARAGFSPPRLKVAYTLGANGRIAAIPFTPLDSPPAAGHNNKILWASRVQSTYGHPLRISAQQMNGTKQLGTPVSRTVPGHPGPSIINLPAPGCWRLTLRWSGHTDQLDLQYNRPR